MTSRGRRLSPHYFVVTRSVVVFYIFTSASNPEDTRRAFAVGFDFNSSEIFVSKSIRGRAKHAVGTVRYRNVRILCE